MSKQIQRQRPGDKRRLEPSKESLKVGDDAEPQQPTPAPTPAQGPEADEPGATSTTTTPEPATAPSPSASPTPEPVPENLKSAAEDKSASPEEEPTGPEPSAATEREPASFLGTAAELRKAWEASVISARTEPKKWTAYSVSLPADLWERLEARVEADQQRYGLPSLAMSHYINTALAGLPKNPRSAAAIATEYVQGYGLVPPTMRPSGTRAHRDVVERMTKLRTQLRRVARPGLIGHLQAAAVSALLETLDSEGETRPSRT